MAYFQMQVFEGYQVAYYKNIFCKEYVIHQNLFKSRLDRKLCCSLGPITCKQFRKEFIRRQIISNQKILQTVLLDTVSYQRKGTYYQTEKTKNRTNLKICLRHWLCKVSIADRPSLLESVVPVEEQNSIRHIKTYGFGGLFPNLKIIPHSLITN